MGTYNENLYIYYRRVKYILYKVNKLKIFNLWNIDKNYSVNKENMTIDYDEWYK